MSFILLKANVYLCLFTVKAIISLNHHVNLLGLFFMIQIYTKILSFKKKGLMLGKLKLHSLILKYSG